MKKIIYISWEHLSEKVARDWFINYLISKGINVEYWDITSLLFKDQEFLPSIKRDFRINISNYQQLEKLLKTNQRLDVCFILLINYEARFYKLFRLFTQYRCKLYHIVWGYFPIKQKGSTKKVINFILHPSKYYKLFEKIILIFSKKLKLIKPLDVIFVAGDASMSMYPETKRKIPFNLCDYDNYIASKSILTKPISTPYCVFLDINLGFHPDIKICKLGDNIDRDDYYTALYRFFEMIENRFKVRVIVAAHPTSNYKKDFFKGRTILKGVTPELVRDSEFVISHHSASISYAVLNRKPILFIYTDEMEQVYGDTVVSWIKDIAEFLHSKVYNIDTINNSDQIVIEDVDVERYDKYKYGYLTTKKSENMLNRDIFLREISSDSD